MRIFVDSSALAKRYIYESGTEKINLKCKKAKEVILSVICIPETVSAFNRLRREKKIHGDIYHELKEEFSEDVAGATVIGINSSVVETTIKCLEQTAVRALDAIHIGSAIEAGTDLFLSADKQQIKAAKTMGLKSEVID